MAYHSDQLDQVFAALSDQTRRGIVMRLCQGGASVGDLAEPFEMALPSFMKHIRVLETSGLIETEKTGRVRRCTLRVGTLESTERWLATQRAIWEGSLDRLEAYVQTMKKEEKSRARRKPRR